MPNPVAYQGVARYETGRSSMSVSTLLNAISGLERAASKRGRKFSLGQTPTAKLAAFFEGPDAEGARDRLAASARQIADLLER